MDTHSSSEPGPVQGRHGRKVRNVLFVMCDQLRADHLGCYGGSGALTTPHMIVIGKDGKVAYNGAIDSINSTDAADIEKADKHVVAALDALLSGKTVELAKTKPYGCGVKYAK